LRIIRWLLLTILGLAVALTFASVIYNASTKDANVPVSELWHGKTVDGTAYREWGTRGTPVVLLGGFLEPSFVWEKVAPLLAEHHRVYALDLDGFGYTERRGPWTLQQWGDQVQAFCKALGLRKPIVVGHSLGAAVAAETARRGLASQIVLVDGDALRGGGPPRWLTTALVKSPFFTTIYRFLLRSPWAVKRILANAYGPNRPAIDGAEIRRWTDQFRAKGARRALEAMAKNGIAGFTRQDLRRLNVPALVVWGASDNVDPVESGRESAHDLHARFILVQGAGHLSMLGGAKAVARAVATPRSAARQ
jgi:pimeloyl-ACP methyl ester carboxylesterase